MLLLRVQEVVDHPALVGLHFLYHPVPDTRFLLKHYLTQSIENKVVHCPHICKFFWILIKNPQSGLIYSVCPNRIRKVRDIHRYAIPPGELSFSKTTYIISFNPTLHRNWSFPTKMPIGVKPLHGYFFHIEIYWKFYFLLIIYNCHSRILDSKSNTVPTVVNDTPTVLLSQVEPVDDAISFFTCKLTPCKTTAFLRRINFHIRIIFRLWNQVVQKRKEGHYTTEPIPTSI